MRGSRDPVAEAIASAAPQETLPLIARPQEWPWPDPTDHVFLHRALEELGVPGVGRNQDGPGIREALINVLHALERGDLAAEWFSERTSLHVPRDRWRGEAGLRVLLAGGMTERQVFGAPPAFGWQAVEHGWVFVSRESLEAVRAQRAGARSPTSSPPPAADESALNDGLRALRNQAAVARAGAKAKAEARHAELRDAILYAARETKADKLVASRSFAESLTDAVQAKLGTSKGASASTIERAIAAILKDGGAP